MLLIGGERRLQFVAVLLAVHTASTRSSSPAFEYVARPARSTIAGREISRPPDALARFARWGSCKRGVSSAVISTLSSFTQTRLDCRARHAASPPCLSARCRLSTICTPSFAHLAPFRKPNGPPWIGPTFSAPSELRSSYTSLDRFACCGSTSASSFSSSENLKACEGRAGSAGTPADA